MKRRDFLKGSSTAAGAAVVGAVAASSFSKPAISQGLLELKMVTTWPKNFPGLGTGAERLAQRITNGSDGKIAVKVFAAGELVPPFESHDAVSGGTADLYHGAEYYWQGKSKAFNFFAAVPFGLTATEMDAWVHHGGGQELWDELAAEFNLKPFLAGNTGVQMGGWFNKEINSLEDYKGLKIRMPGLGGEVLRRIGAAAVNLPGSEIFQALQSGNIDATEWVGPWNDLAFGFYKVAKFYYYPGFHEPGTALGSGVNKSVWDGLSSEHKALIESAMAAENNFTLAEFNARNNASLNTLVAEHGVQVRRFSNDVMNAIGNSSGDVVAEAAGADAIPRGFITVSSPSGATRSAGRNCRTKPTGMRVCCRSNTTAHGAGCVSRVVEIGFGASPSGLSFAAVRPRGQGFRRRLADRGFPIHRLCASGFGRKRGAPRGASALFRDTAARSVF